MTLRHQLQLQNSFNPDWIPKKLHPDWTPKRIQPDWTQKRLHPGWTQKIMCHPERSLSQSHRERRSRRTCISPHRRTLYLAVLAPILAAFLATSPARAQGCTQCQDNTAATPPKTQAAYRHAIILLTGTASTVFLGSLFLFKRNR
jgi:hypothetical protein